MASKLKIGAGSKIFGGFQHIVTYESKELGLKTNFSVYLPPQAKKCKVPVIYWLSGLTFNEKSFAQRSGAQRYFSSYIWFFLTLTFCRYAAEHGVALVSPDTSPRGVKIPGDSDFWDFGLGAGFYLNATKDPWKKNYRMYDYFICELLGLVNENFPVESDKKSIFGHRLF